MAADDVVVRQHYTSIRSQDSLARFNQQCENVQYMHALGTVVAVYIRQRSHDDPEARYNGEEF